jgi:serine/threonine-protein kinase RsbW
MSQRRILVVDDDNDLREELEPTLTEFGYEIVSIHHHDAAVARHDLAAFDLIITDLTEDTAEGQQLINEIQFHRSNPTISVSSAVAETTGVTKAFKIDASNFIDESYRSDELRAIVERSLSYKTQIIDPVNLLASVHEKIEFTFPSDVSLMDAVLNYLVGRVAKFGLINPENSNLFIALDEAFVNAVKHGNRYDPKKIVHISADLSPDEARFTVEDEGEGFNPKQIPDPCDSENLFKTSGRGVLLIHNIMDEVEYSERGNRLTMVKRPETETRKLKDIETKNGNS